MAATFEAIDFQHDGIAWFAFDIHLRSGAGCATWPMLTRFVPRLLAGCGPGTIDFVRRLAFERVVRTMVVVPINDERCFLLILRLEFRYRRQPDNVLERPMKTFDHGDAAMFTDGAEPRQDASPLTPVFFKVLAFELGPLIDNEVFRFGLFPFDNLVESRSHILGRVLNAANPIERLEK